MRLIVATSSYPTRADEAVNAGVFVRDIVGQLVEQGHGVHVLTPEKGEPISGSPAPVRTFAWGGSEKVLTRLNPRHPADLLRLARLMWGGRAALQRLVAETRAEGLIGMWAIPAGFWAEGAAVPYAVWVLGSDIWGADKYPLGRNIVRQVLRRARHVFANSLYLVEGVQQLAGREAEFLAAGRRLPVEAVSVAPLPAGRRHLLFIGRWDHVKGIDVLLEAIETVVAQVPNVHLHLFGGGPLGPEIKVRARQGRLRECVTVYGFADPPTVVGYCKACEALIIPSRIESIPVLYSDALQCGCPVVVTEVGDLGRLVREQGTGLVCPPEDPTALADAICRMLSGGTINRAHYAPALARAAAMFDPARNASRCAEVLAQPVR